MPVPAHSHRSATGRLRAHTVQPTVPALLEDSTCRMSMRRRLALPARTACERANSTLNSLRSLRIGSGCGSDAVIGLDPIRSRFSRTMKVSARRMQRNTRAEKNGRALVGAWRMRRCDAAALLGGHVREAYVRARLRVFRPNRPLNESEKTANRLGPPRCAAS